MTTSGNEPVVTIRVGMNTPPGPEVVSAPDVTCCLCSLNFRSEGVRLGPLYRNGKLVAHHFCLILSSGLSQNGEDDEGILGFLPEDVERELRRGKQLRCTLCNKTTATVGCAVRRCRRTYHLPCCLTSGGLSQFYGQYNTYCHEHRPVQKIPDVFWRKKRSANSKEKKGRSEGAMLKNGSCGVCLDRIHLKPSMNLLWSPCCRGWFHRRCLESMADSAGAHFFKCPLCNNKDVFEREMLKFGIYIPDRDAKWEMEPDAFEELYWRHSTCDAPACVCPEGRRYNLEDTDYELVLCELCGSEGVHVVCARLDPVNLRWKCYTCVEALRAGPTASAHTVPTARAHTAHALQPSSQPRLNPIWKETRCTGSDTTESKSCDRTNRSATSYIYDNTTRSCTRSSSDTTPSSGTFFSCDTRTMSGTCSRSDTNRSSSTCSRSDANRRSSTCSRTDNTTRSGTSCSCDTRIMSGTCSRSDTTRRSSTCPSSDYTTRSGTSFSCVNTMKSSTCSSNTSANCRVLLPRLDINRYNIGNRCLIFPTSSSSSILVDSPSPGAAYLCKLCRFSTNCQEGLDRHTQLHDPGRRHVCSECGLRFQKSGHLKVHYRQHSGEKPFPCGHCGLRFSELKRLHLHLDKHDMTRQFECLHCGWRFKSQQALAIHTEKDHDTLSASHNGLQSGGSGEMPSEDDRDNEDWTEEKQLREGVSYLVARQGRPQCVVFLDDCDTAPAEEAVTLFVAAGGEALNSSLDVVEVEEEVNQAPDPLAEAASSPTSGSSAEVDEGEMDLKTEIISLEPESIGLESEDI